MAEGVTLYTPDKIRVGTGDRMRFTKSDRERGYVANSVWTVTAVSGDSVTLSDGQQTRVIRPGQERAEQHIDLAYAITAHGAQGASETFAIALEGTEGNRKLMAGLVMTVLTVGLVSCAGKSLPRFWPGDFFPTFYACHLAVLGVLAL